MTEQYIYFAAYDQHLNFGFYYGAALPDPSGLLTGTGKSMRSVRIAELGDLQNQALRKLVQAAIAHLTGVT